MELNRDDTRAAIKNLIGTLIESDFVRKVGETFATRIFLIGIGLVTSVIAARILGPEGRGLYSIAVAVGAIGVQFGNLGLHASNTYYVAKDRSLLSALFGNTLVVSFILGGLFSVLAWVVFQLLPGIAPIKGGLLAISLLWIPLGLAYLLTQNLLLGIHEIRSYNKIEVANSIIPIFLIGGLIYGGSVTAETVFLAGFVALAASFVWAFLRLKAHLNRPAKPSLALFRENFRYGFKAYLAAFFAFLVLRVDLLMVKYMLGAEQAGYYSIAVAMADMILMLPIVTGTILFPRLSAMVDDKEKWNYTKKAAYGVAFTMAVLVVIALLLADPVVRVLYGKAFLPAVPAFVWLMPGILMLSINTIYMNYFASIGMPLVTVYSPFAAFLVNILINLKFIPLFGIVGASISSIVSYGLMLMISYYFIVRQKALSDGL